MNGLSGAHESLTQPVTQLTIDVIASGTTPLASRAMAIGCVYIGFIFYDWY